MTAQRRNDSSLHGKVESLPRDFLDTEIIADPLNGLIPISIFEKRIIASPEFQRLRKIKQLGFANLVYPAAEYSRFVHSIGACHQAKNIVDTVNENLRNSPRYRRWRVSGKNDGPEPDWDSVYISPFERVLIAAAALLHDLSHGPFSHEIEGIVDDEGSTVIPDHDDYRRNPALFLYLFDREVSQLAAILFHFNRAFAPALIRDAEAVNDKTALPCDCRLAIKSLLSQKVIAPYGAVKVGGTSPLRAAQNGHGQQFNELALLPVLIFEILLFEKQDEWLAPNDKVRVLHVQSRESEFGIRVKTGWDGGEILWCPLPGWFRAYRKDIIGNTICADLIDYVGRDGYHTGIVSTMDLKFLDRMLIARATLPPIDPDGRSLIRPPGNVIGYADIPLSCEHIVFDIYDHKRGFIRQSVLTEILNYLQGRYLLCERVYVHRVVEAARGMLQQAVWLLSSIRKETDPSRALLSIRDLHPLDEAGFGSPTSPIGDDALLNWVRALPALEETTYEKNRASIDQAIELATLLLERRIYREAIIYDGIHGFDPPGCLIGPKENCRALEAVLLTNSALRADVGDVLEQLEEMLEEALNAQVWNVQDKRPRFQPKTSVLLSVGKWGKRYKPPLVLVARPFKEKGVEHSALDIQPLLDCGDPPNIKKQLDALKDSYDSLWKVYLFVHPIFHDQKFRDVHYDVDKQLSDFVAKHTGSRWRNAIDFEQLLQEPIDNQSLMAQAETATAPDVPLSAELIMSLFRPLTTQDLETRTRLQLRCEQFLEEFKKLPIDKQTVVRSKLMKVPMYQPKLPAIVNRFSAEQIERKLRRILNQAREVNAGEEE